MYSNVSASTCQLSNRYHLHLSQHQFEIDRFFFYFFFARETKTARSGHDVTFAQKCKITLEFKHRR